MRTQCNMRGEQDLAAARSLQDRLVLTQSDPGSYRPSHSWDMEELLAARARYQKLFAERGYTSDALFGKKVPALPTPSRAARLFSPTAFPQGEVPLEAHNVGAAYGWGGLTKDQAIYLAYEPTSHAAQAPLPPHDQRPAEGPPVEQTQTCRRARLCSLLCSSPPPVPGAHAQGRARARLLVHHRLRRRRLPKRRVVQPQQRLRGPADGAVAVRFGGNPAAPNHLDIFEVSSPARIMIIHLAPP